MSHLTPFLKGNIPWNKGKTNIYSKETLDKMRNARIGKKTSIETRKKMSKTKIGKKFTKEHKQKIGKALTGRIFSQETRQKHRERMINNPNRKFKDTGIELKIEEELKERGVNYQKQVPLCKITIVDFYLPDDKIVIECDGCYWHNCSIHSKKIIPKRTEKDKEKDKILKKNGYKVYRFWEHEINKSSKDCINKIDP